MARKGNLLYNGDFETGTTEGWELGAFGKICKHSLTPSPEAALRGFYGGLLKAAYNLAECYLAYDKTCSFEEYEAYLFILPFKAVNVMCNYGYLYGLDDKGNLIKEFWLGYNKDEGIWRKFVALLRGFSDITHFKVGMYVYQASFGDKLYFDEVKLYPLKSIKSVELAETRRFDELKGNYTWYSGLACIGQCRLRSIVKVEYVSGDSPSLDITVRTGMFDVTGTCYEVSHNTFTAEGFDEVKVDLPELSWMSIEYKVSGTNPSFTFTHALRVEPNKQVETGTAI